MQRRIAAAMLATACTAAVSTAQTLTTQTIATGFASPVQAVSNPGEPNLLYIVEQRSGSTGRVRVIDLTNNSIRPTPFLTVAVSTSSEQGLLGMAFHPDYANNGRVFINYTNTSGTTVVAEYARSADGTTATFVRNIITVAQPFSNHNAGWLGFSPNDGYLYIPLGDGGSGNDPGNRSQNLNELLGKILRIDVDSGDGFPADNNRYYTIPPTNPYAGATAGLDEIFAYGLRNPYRCAFDPATGDLYIGDVGQNAREEVSFLPAGTSGRQNFGWRCWEGFLDTPNVPNDCGAQSGITFPLIDYTRVGGNCSVIGGEVYRGSAIAGLDGTYFYADYCTANFWSLTVTNGVASAPVNRNAQLRIASGFPVGFGTDAAGEIYICEQGGNGRIRKIVAQPCNIADVSPAFNDIDINDILAFAAAFDALEPVADVTGEGEIDINDILTFAAAFDAGCP